MPTRRKPFAFAAAMVLSLSGWIIVSPAQGSGSWRYYLPQIDQVADGITNSRILIEDQAALIKTFPYNKQQNFNVVYDNLAGEIHQFCFDLESPIKRGKPVNWHAVDLKRQEIVKEVKQDEVTAQKIIDQFERSNHAGGARGLGAFDLTSIIPKLLTVIGDTQSGWDNLSKSDREQFATDIGNIEYTRWNSLKSSSGVSETSSPQAKSTNKAH